MCKFKPHVLLIAMGLMFVACGQSNRQTVSNTEIYDVLHGEWNITEIHLVNGDEDSDHSLTKLDFESELSSIAFYRPTLGDPARLNVFWTCSGFAFSFDYSDDKFTRLSEIVGPMGFQWSTAFALNEGAQIETRLTCGGPVNVDEQELAEIASNMSKIAKRFTQFQHYEFELLEGNIVSLFTILGDGLYAVRR